MRDLALIGVILVWGLNYVVLKIGLRELDAGVFTLVRFLGATPFLFCLLARSGEDWRLPRADLPRAAAVGLLGTTAYQTGFALATRLTTAANLSLLMALSPVFAALLGWATGRDRPSAATFAGSAIALTGAALVIGGGRQAIAFGLQTLGGDLVALLASFLWAAYAVVAQPLLARHSGLKVTAYAGLFGALGLLAASGPAALRTAWASLAWPTWASLLYSTGLVTVFGLVTWYNSIGHIGPTRVMAYMFLQPVTAIASAAVFLGERLTGWQVAGALLALAGIGLIRRPRRPPQEAAPQAEPDPMAAD